MIFKQTMQYRISEMNRPSQKLLHILCTPFIYMLIIPLVFFDILIEIYQRVCFPLCELKVVNRWDYIRIDRHKLSYLNWLEKINCAYCGYANGWFNYAKTIASETEAYWCGITHAKYKRFKEPEHHKTFLKYNDEEAFKKFAKKL